jgi:hypothetical protein
MYVQLRLASGVNGLLSVQSFQSHSVLTAISDKIIFEKETQHISSAKVWKNRYQQGNRGQCCLEATAAASLAQPGKSLPPGMATQQHRRAPNPHNNQFTVHISD